MVLHFVKRDLIRQVQRIYIGRNKKALCIKRTLLNALEG